MRISSDERKHIYVKAEIKQQAKQKRDLCGNGKKVRYTTRKKALKALNLTGTIAKKEHRPVVLRIYKCPYCQGWHLTKQRQRSFAENIGDAMVDEKPHKTGERM